jgi:head-tail adaptor
MSAEFAGALDQRVTLRRRDPARDDLGAPGAGWASVGALWAQVAPLPPATWGEGDRPAAAQRWRATVRAGADVRPGDALDWRGAGFAVRSVVADPALPDRLVLHLEALP